jgi:hypothetical protein
MPEFKSDALVKAPAGVVLTEGGATAVDALSSAAAESYNVVGSVAGLGDVNSYHYSESSVGLWLGGANGYAYKGASDYFGEWSFVSVSGGVFDFASDGLPAGRMIQLRSGASNPHYKDTLAGSWNVGTTYAGSKTGHVAATYSSYGSSGFVVAFDDGQVQVSVDAQASWAIIRASSGAGTCENRCLFTREDNRVILFTQDDVRRWNLGASWTSIGGTWSNFIRAAYNPLTDSFLVIADTSIYLGINGGNDWSVISVPSSHSWATVTSLHPAAVGSAWVLWDSLADHWVYFLQRAPTVWQSLPFGGRGGTVPRGMGSDGRRWFHVDDNENLIISNSVGVLAPRLR